MKGSWLYTLMGLLCFSNTAFGDFMAADKVGIGQLASILMVPTAGIAKIMMAMAFVAGVGFIMGAIIQYKYHRENPQQVRLSTPILLLALGCALLALPFVAQLSSSNPINYELSQVQW
ncbi:MAG: hypothetical protein ACX932_06305 [Gammaproteobacteria bacterium]